MAWQAFTPARGGLRRWLQASGSLSARLAATGQHFSVQVLAQGRQPLTLDESCALGLGGRRIGYAREVVLRVDGQAMVFARSVTSHADSVGAWRSVRGLGSRPLADVLFKRAGISRAPLAYSQLKRQSPLQRHVASSWQTATGVVLAHPALPARRSVFTRHGATLLVMEVFAVPAGHWRWPQAAPRKIFKQRT
ncbi:chorismate lyase [Rhodoferax sp.]|jgi:chorismate--pyruvate lyase|uniref:chorismate--pyruvate lyase family protein n=1 Tax=Rhodoferax sp. TaxID=50421 RepID=UPI00271B2130|nr:chorismate lyase [Rhodoferax sp.]MDO9143657.1 chorismate lyase [Rhodoferax sp.]MDP3190182.1 chorismate lyase [Rhodoferax sp.]MDP3335606.1 chorismate lyase [Rhodoferax sp.]MDP3865184.1 chorismate lyase [Rhodoferax sp.]